MAITLALAAIPFGGGAYVLRLAVVPPRVIDVATLMDREQTSVGDYVTVRITPRVDDLVEVGDLARTDAYLLGIEEDPRLILYAESGTDIAEVIFSGSEPAGPCNVTGLVHELDDYEHLTSDIPSHLVDEHARAVYGETPPPGVRILEIGPSRFFFAFVGGASIVMCGVPLLALALYGFIRARQIERRPKSF